MGVEEWHALTAHDWAFWVAGLFALLEFGRWLYSFNEFFFEKVGIKTKGMLKREEFNNRLKQVETSIEEIKNHPNIMLKCSLSMKGKWLVNSWI